MELERTFSRAGGPPERSSEERIADDNERRAEEPDDGIDSFPSEESPYTRALRLDDVDALDRARADEAIAATAPFEGPRPTHSPRPTLVAVAGRRRAPGIRPLGLPAMALVAIIGWGAFFLERMRFLPQPHDERPPAGVAEVGAVISEAPLPARALSALAPLLGVVAAARPSPPAPVAASPANLTGSWTLMRAVESSSDDAFTGMTFGYELRLQQRGGRITGSGHRVSENGRDVAKQGQVPVQLQGTIAGSRLTLNFTEGAGRARRTVRFLLVVEEPGVLRGRFSSNAADSKGSAQAQRRTG